MFRKATSLLTALIAVGSLAMIGYWMLFSSFAVYDDEGYILLSARKYYTRGQLYESVYSQYGPAFYALLDILQHVAGAPVDHTWARLLTLAFWIGTAGCCSLLVWRQTASRSLTLFSLSATFLFLYFIIDEPFHPGSLIFFTLAVSLCLTTRLIAREKLGSAAAVAGCAGAILLLTKINVGVFYLASVGGWALINSAFFQANRFSRPSLVAGFILVAVALMHALIRETWVQIYLLLFASGAITLVIAMKKEALLTSKHAGCFLGASICTGIAILTLIWLRGTSVGGLIEGVLLGPLRHPGNYSYPVDWRPGSLVLAGLSLTLAIAYPWIGRRFSAETADRFIVALRLTLGAALLMGFALLINFRAVGAIFSYVAPLIWIWVVPLKGVETSPADRASRGLLATVLLLQYLHAYPVGGSQESWGTFLFISLVAVGLGDVRTWFERRQSVNATISSMWWPRLATIIVVTLIAKVGYTGQVAYRTYTDRTALNLPGAKELHLPESQRTAYRILALNAVVHTDMLFSLPGMFSFNLWTGLPTPTDKNTTLWLTLLNAAEQRTIIQSLENTPRAGLIVQESLLALMRENKIPLQGELWDYLHEKFNMAFRTEGFAFWVHAGKTIAPLNIATIRRLPDNPVGRPRTIQVEFCLIHSGPPIATIEVHSMTEPGLKPRRLNAANASATTTAINRSGQTAAAAIETPWPLQCEGFNRLAIRYDDENLIPPLATTLLILKGPNGESLGEVRLGE